MNASNLAMQAKLKRMMEEAALDGARFSPQGMHYLACRANGVKYRKALYGSFESLLARELLTVIPNDVLARAQAAFGLETLPEEALIILSTGRKPMLNRKGEWQEEQVSLVDVKPMAPENLVKLDAKVKERVMKAHTLRMEQSACSIALLDFFNSLYESKHPPMVEAPVVKAKKAKKVVPIRPEVTVEEPVAETVVEPVEEPVAVVEKPAKKKSKSKAKKVAESVPVVENAAVEVVEVPVESEPSIAVE